MSKRYLRFAAIVLAVSMAVVGLFACGNPKDQANANFCGTWELSGMQLESMSYTEQDLAALKETGLTCYLTITNDDKAVLEMFGNTVSATWSAKDANTAELKLDGGASTAQNANMAAVQTMKFANDTISMESNGTSLTFKKIKPEDKVPTASPENQSAASEPSQSEAKKDEAPQESSSSSSEQASEEQANSGEEAQNES